MTKLFPLIAAVSLLAACQQVSHTGNDGTKQPERRPTVQLHSDKANYDYTIFIDLPPGYDAKHNHYPVVYILDANFYFDMVAAMLDKYSSLGFMQPVILVGIGYKDFQTMDSLRDRDYTYPAALPDDSMTVSGNGEKFLSFINDELVRYMDSNYSTDPNQRTLVGHSLGGLFSLYALKQQLAGKHHTFNAYVAVSPHLRYNHYKIIHDLDSVGPANSKLKLYVTYGGLEDEEEKDEQNYPGYQTTAENMKALTAAFAKQSNVAYESELFSNLGHMDVPMPSFHKGLLWIFSE